MPSPSSCHMGRVKFVNSLQSLFSERERHSLSVGGDIFERNSVRVHLRMYSIYNDLYLLKQLWENYLVLGSSFFLIILREGTLVRFCLFDFSPRTKFYIAYQQVTVWNIVCYISYIQNCFFWWWWYMRD